MLHNMCCGILTAGHLVLIENMGAWFVPYTTIQLLKRSTVSFAMQDDRNLVKLASGQIQLSSVVEGLEEDALEYLFINPLATASHDYVSTHGYIKASFGNLAVYLAWTCVSWFVVFQTLSVFCLFWEGAADYRAGTYLAFTWRMRRSCVYKLMVGGLLVISMILFGSFGLYLVVFSRRDLLWTTLQPLISDYAMWCYGLYKLIDHVSPPFQWKSKKFHDLSFNRPLLWLRHNNDQFALRLQWALLYSQRRQDVPDAKILDLDERTAGVRKISRVLLSSDCNESSEEEPDSPTLHAFAPYVPVSQEDELDEACGDAVTCWEAKPA
ncbi:unnamed protein product [Symbiodinium sp. CCMP2592]|nr:unnamed protein product [Symbiodinium sp. CCMP2592]